MKREIRPSTPADGPAIAALLVQEGLSPNIEPAQLHWKYWQERADWPRPRSYVLTQGTQIVGHAGVVPGACAWGTDRAVVIHLIDWAARKTAVGAGVALLKHIGRLTDVLLGVGGSEDTLRILPHLGFRTVANATEYVCGLYPLRHSTYNINPLWTWPPRLARSLIWTWSTGVRCGDWQARHVTADELPTLTGFLPASRNGRAVFERSPALFEYFLGCPIAPMRLYALEQAGRARGYFLLAFAPGEARLADCWLDSDDPAAWRGLISCAVRTAAASDCPTLATLASEPGLSRGLLECGFQVRRTLPVQWLPVAGTKFPGESLHIQMLDFDGAYLYHPEPQATLHAAGRRDDAQAPGPVPQS
jgi:hypothetical protein